LKRKKTNIILIASLLLIWGSVIYRVVTYKKENHYTPSNINQQQNTPGKTKFVDTFNLLLNYPDPFLTSSPTPPITQRTSTSKNTYKVQNTQRTTITQPNEHITSEKFPDIIYSSYVEKDGNLTAIIQMNGKKYLIEETGEISDVKILSISKEHIKIKWKSEQKLIRKM
jgi:hypothetical protein